VSFFRIPSPLSGSAERAKKGRTSTIQLDQMIKMKLTLLNLLALDEIEANC
jgi:hypothetical protein